MRVIAGELRGRRLVAPRGLAVRPTADRLREAVFSALGSRVEDAIVWDACAGTGAVGLEALSRGARWCLFSEPSRPALRALRQNLEACRLAGDGDRAEVLAGTWQRAARLLTARRVHPTIVYYDPPWADADVDGFLRTVAPLVAADGLVLVEHPAGREPERAGRTFRAGDSAVSWLAAETLRRDYGSG